MLNLRKTMDSGTRKAEVLNSLIINTMSVVSFALAVVFIIKLWTLSPLFQRP